MFVTSSVHKVRSQRKNKHPKTKLNQGTIASELDKADGFIHLSDLTGPRVVAKLFFTTATDLELLELDSSKLGDAAWVVGNMGDAAPDSATLANSPITVHYLLPDGCVHGAFCAAFRL